MSTITQPDLAPPGAGLPQPELAIARLMVRGGAFFASRARSAAKFARERDAVLALARDCSPAHAERRVLIKRLPGLEDSSRFWSIYMTVEHLRIVNEGIGRIITQLARGEAPARPTRTADVKPAENVSSAVLNQFEQGCGELEQAVSAVADLRSSAKHLHPWFGPLDAAGWYYLAGFHLGLHRRQMERIWQKLATSGC